MISRRLLGCTVIATILVAGSCASSHVDTPDGPPPISAAAADGPIMALAPNVAYAVFDLDDGRCRLVDGVAHEQALPIASAFKLWVLIALGHAIAGGRLSWDDDLVVRDELRSDPSGELYTVPDGSTVTVRHAAELMISISDNSATDHLISLIGAQTVEAVIAEVAPASSEQNIPLLTTADMARLKFVAPELGAEYEALDGVGERRRFLTDLADRAPFPWQEDPTAVANLDLSSPRLVQSVEWFATPTDLCTTIRELAALADTPGLEPIDAILSANPGIPQDLSDTWNHAWFKGGSEPGVLALTYRLIDDSHDRAVIAMWNDPNDPLPTGPVLDDAIRALLAAAHG
ncbi:serine hydrolase [Phytoactinopolyspora halotolerans]|uniref:Serine hydrolase n=1 Tax=Phytoactinopolyspora halotolerans TaxID=1981512 RepID=A0A6L9SEF1_9ACTN|nr:serine hydrolase [Phytoactinopolyspora halotolerans]NEE02984.1 serine hydrolase [Phytoactinopolyspora halotolerans]